MTDTPGPTFEQALAQLEQIVQRLEKGELSLEESLDRFSEGIALVKKGEALLAEAEKRVEQLLSEDGRSAPLKLPEEGRPGTAVATPMASKAVRRQGPPPSDEDDVPF